MEKQIVKPVISNNPDDMDIPGVVVTFSLEEADKLGAFCETAMSEEDAWESNLNPYGIDDTTITESPHKL